MLTVFTLVLLVTLVLVTIVVVFYCNAKKKAFRDTSSSLADILKEGRNGVQLDPSWLLLDIEKEHQSPEQSEESENESQVVQHNTQRHHHQRHHHVHAKKKKHRKGKKRHTRGSQDSYD